MQLLFIDGSKNLLKYLINSNNFFFGHAPRLAGSQFPDQGLNQAPAVKALSPNS